MYRTPGIQKGPVDSHTRRLEVHGGRKRVWVMSGSGGRQGGQL